MKKYYFLTIGLILSVLALFSFTSINYSNNESTLTSLSSTSAPTWHIVYYVNRVEKKVYMSRPFNNDCYPCREKITEAYAGYLKQSGYQKTVMLDAIVVFSNSKEADIMEREATEIEKINPNFELIRVGFSYP
jgi:hypothetical protein